jgi:uncharacterized protein
MKNFFELMAYSISEGGTNAYFSFTSGLSKDKISQLLSVDSNEVMISNIEFNSDAPPYSVFVYLDISDNSDWSPEEEPSAAELQVAFNETVTKIEETFQSAYNTILGGEEWQGWSELHEFDQLLDWCRKANEPETSKAQLAIAKMFSTGQGVPRDLDKALVWYFEAANLGSSAAQLAIADYYMDGEWVVQDYHQALEWYSSAAENGNSIAQLAIANMFRKGTGVTQDIDEALICYEKAAEAGNSTAQVALAEMYHRGLEVSQDYDKALFWYSEATELGNSSAQLALGNLFSCGTFESIPLSTGSVADPSEDQLFDLDFHVDVNPKSRIRAIQPRDYRKAERFYREAANKGVAEAQLGLAKLYIEGCGVSQNHTIAYMWCSLAGNEVLEESEQLKAICMNNMSSAQVSRAGEMAREWLSKKQKVFADI